MPNRAISIFKRQPRNLSEDLMDSFFGEPMMRYNYTQTEIDMYEDEDNVIVELKAPGFKDEDIEINVEDDMLSITGKTTQSVEENKERKYYYKEMRTESFARSINLPVKVLAEKANAEFENGILKIKLPKAEEVKPKKISITTSKR
jgi:HSP20 family protein